ncbi:MAG: NUDIX hydrolase [Acidobacteria bacterium]|nr:NUDIX hydrolase [Acidobacteriota bacterium]MBI3472331.1 NUDIX hydrolase [Candidatus Solibacter usitatus]
MKLLSSREVYRCGLFQVTEDHATDGKGYEIRRSVVRHSGSAVMMAVDARKRVLLVRQYRLAAGQYLWELPAGRLDPGENPLQAARRELREETGYRARRWRKLVSYYATPGFVAERMNLFLATGLIEGQAQPMDDERIECRWFTGAEMDRMIRSGKVQDGKTILGFLMWQRYS